VLVVVLVVVVDFLQARGSAVGGIHSSRRRQQTLRGLSAPDGFDRQGKKSTTTTRTTTRTRV